MAVKKTQVLFILASLLSACNLTVPDLGDLLRPGVIQNTATHLSQPTQTNLQEASVTPFITTQTFTPTPTKVGELAASMTPFFTAQVQSPIPSATSMATSVGDGFDAVEISGNAIFWGVCKPGEVKITAFVTKPGRVVAVVIFVHLVDTTSDNSTPWSTGDVMDKWPNGKYTYTFDADVIDEHRHYKKAWVVYQLVATGVKAVIVGRTPIFLNNLTLAPCP